MTRPFALALLLAWSAAGPHPRQAATPHDPLVGKPAPAITADEWIPSRPAWKGKVVLLDFWATWCGPCIAQFPTMREWQQRFGSDLVIVGMTNLEGQTAEEIKAFLAKERVPWPIAIDHAGATHKAFGVEPLPHTFLIDRRGVVRTAHVGGKGFADLLPEVEKLVADR